MRLLNWEGVFMCSPLIQRVIEDDNGSKTIILVSVPGQRTAEGVKNVNKCQQRGDQPVAVTPIRNAKHEPSFQNAPVFALNLCFV
jgi:hypothetical protein